MAWKRSPTGNAWEYYGKDSQGRSYQLRVNKYGKRYYYQANGAWGSKEGNPVDDLASAKAAAAQIVKENS